MNFILGFITCLLLVIATCLLEARFDGQVVKRASEKASNAILKRRVELFTPETDEIRLSEELLARNSAAGKVTRLEDL